MLEFVVGCPSARRWNEELSTAAIELSVDPRGVAEQDLGRWIGVMARPSWLPWTIGRPMGPSCATLPPSAVICSSRWDDWGCMWRHLQWRCWAARCRRAVVIGLMGQGHGPGAVVEAGPEAGRPGPGAGEASTAPLQTQCHGGCGGYGLL